MICNKFVECIQNGPCKQYQKQCIVFCDTRSTPSCSEKNKTYMLNIGTHQFNVTLYHIDAGVINDNNAMKCDYAFALPQELIFVELKGNEVRHAIEQLLATINCLQVDRSKMRLYGRISTTSNAIPKIMTNEQLRLEKILKKSGGNLKIKKTVFQEDYSSLNSK